MAIEFAQLTGSPDDPWVLPVARLVFHAIHGGAGEPWRELVEPIAHPTSTDVYFRLSDEHGLIAMAHLDIKSHPAAPHEYELAALAVDPRRQEEGFGKYMLQRVERSARGLGAQTLRIFPNEDAEPFYKKLCYETHPEDGEFLVKLLPEDMPPVESPEPWRAPTDVSVEAVEAIITRMMRLAELAGRLLLDASIHSNNAWRGFERVWGAEVALEAHIPSVYRSEAYQRARIARRALHKAVNELDAYRAQITGTSG